MKNIVVFFGGVSCEHDISIITGLQVLENIDKKLYKIYPVYISKSGKWFYDKNFKDVKQFIDFQESKYEQSFILSGQPKLFVKKGPFLKKVTNVDCAVICCHGMNGEDGTLQGLLELSKIPYTSSGVLGSSVCMDKIFMKMILEVNNFPITNYIWFDYDNFVENKSSFLAKIETQLHYPIMVKPSNLGSSIGISRCNNQQELLKAIEVASKYDFRILLEDAIINLREINCGCFGNDNNVITSNLEEPLSWQKFLTFDDKYLHFSGVKFEKNKFNLDKNLIKDIKEMSKKIFKTFCCDGMVRIDFLLDSKTDEIFVNEINTIPGSFANYLWDNKSYKDLINELIENANYKFQKKQLNTYTYESEALSNYSSKSKLRKLKK